MLLSKNYDSRRRCPKMHLHNVREILLQCNFDILNPSIFVPKRHMHFCFRILVLINFDSKMWHDKTKEIN